MKPDTIVRTCPVCGVTYLADAGRLKHGRQTTCSRACSYRFRTQKLENKTSILCARCGAEFKRPLSHIKSKNNNHFCSRTCHYAGRGEGLTSRIVTRSYVVTEAGRAGWKAGALKARDTRRERDNYRHTDAARAKLSEATARALAERRLYVSSKLEE